jgi:hypothetical protein
VHWGCGVKGADMYPAFCAALTGLCLQPKVIPGYSNFLGVGLRFLDSGAVQ